MKKTLLASTAIAVMTMFVAAVIANDEPPITGTFTATTHAVTNTLGKRWLVSCGVIGSITNGTDAKIILNNSYVGSGLGLFLANSTTTTNSLVYDANEDISWERLGVITFSLPGRASGTTNDFFIIYTNERKK